MLKNKEKVRKIRNIVIVLMAIIMLLSFYIKIRYSRTKEVNTIAVDEFGNMKSTTIAAIDLDRGTIIPEYKPKWEKQGSTLDLTNQILTVTVKGSAYKTQVINPDVAINYASDVTSALKAEDITVFIDGVEVTSQTNPKVVVNTGVETTNATSNKTEITHTIVLSNLESATREAGKLYKDWSGNVSIKIAGRGESTDTYDADVLIDDYGNQNMMETDEGQEDGTWIDVDFKDAQTNKNEDGVMFIDYIEPEFTYAFSETTIGDGNHGDTKILTVVFYIADKYFDAGNSTGLQLADLTFKVEGETVDINVTGNTLTPESLPDGTGIKYTLVVKNLEKTTGEPYRDYSGPVSIVLPADKFVDYSGNTNSEKTITIGVDEPINSYTAPYLPTGYSVVEGTDLNTGLVIQDGSGNQFVWVEVPKSEALYKRAGINLNLDSLSGTDLTVAYTNIENDLHDYTVDYRNGTTYKDEHSGNDATTSLTSGEYTTLKQKMLKSIYQNGGFYVGRYETGTTTARTAGSDTLTTPLIKPNVYPYTFVTTSKAQELSEQFATTGYTSSLMFGVQWDLVLKYIETKGAATVVELNEDSKDIGNYSNNLWNITNTSSKHATSSSTWTDGAYGQKTSPANIILSTGASETFNTQNIYDIAGNAWEWTLERTYDSGNPCVRRGGIYSKTGAEFPASSRRMDNPNDAYLSYGFRTALYKDTKAEDYELINQPEIVDVVDPIWEAENININHGTKQVTVDLVATDKYYESSSLSVGEDLNSNGTLDEGEDKNGNGVLDANNIDIYIDGVKITTTDNVKKSLSAPTPLTEQRIVDGEWQDVVYGVKYTLTITDWEEDERQAGKNFKEWSGTTTIEIAGNTIEDKYGNKSNLQNFTLEHVDFIKPEIEKVSSTRGTNTETIVFTATDKYFDLTDATNIIEKSDIIIWVDDENATADLIDDATLTSRSIDGGYEYTLVLSNLQQDPNDGFDFSGIVTIAIPKEKIRDTIGNTNNAQTITVGIDGPEETSELPSTDYTTPYMPTGYSYVEGNLNDGLVIADPLGNEYVWVEVPTSIYDNSTYNTETTSGDRKPASNADYDDIEYCLKQYTASYSEEGFEDTYADGKGIEDESAYKTLKQTMLKSVYENGGFYVGKYETGTMTARDSKDDEITTAVVQADAYPYTYVTNKQAQELASGMASGDRTSSLMFGLQWDLVLRHMQEKGTAVADLNSDSTEWGNYYNNTYTTSASSSYSTNSGSSWTPGAYDKASSASVLLTTGASSEFEKEGIYDVAGNVWEWTLETCTSGSIGPCVGRGGFYYEVGNYPASFRSDFSTSVSIYYVGFRVAIY